MNVCQSTSRVCLFALVVILLSACGTGAGQTSTTPTVAATELSAVPTSVSVPNLSKCGDEYSRPPSSSSYIPEGSTLDPNTVYTPTINITRADYEAALAWWQAQGVSEYEIEVYTLSFGGSGTVLHVAEDKVEMLGRFYSSESPVQETPVTTVPTKYDLENTVDGLFTHVDSILSLGICPIRGAMAFPVAYNIEFDEALGYPTSISMSASEPDEWSKQGIYSSLPAHSSYNTIVRKLTIIKRSTP